MKYFIRAVKYFIYIVFIFTFVIWAMSCLSNQKLMYTPMEIVNNLTHGWNSVWMILGMFAIFSAIYPMLGYMKKILNFSGSIEEYKAEFDEFMDIRGYSLEKNSDECLCYRLNGAMSRLSRSFEDRITIRQSARGFEIEGIRKDVVRIASGLESKFGPRIS